MNVLYAVSGMAALEEGPNLSTRKLAEITNESPKDMHLNLEPFAFTYLLEPGGVLDVLASGSTQSLALRFGVHDDQRLYVSVWNNSEGPGELRFERDGRDVFET